MSYEMRRKDRELSEAEAWKILNDGKYGVLSVMGSDGYPYGVPMHYVVIDDKIYMHGTAEGGHKHDGMIKHPKISFTVMEMEDNIKGRSAIVFGTVLSVPEKCEMVMNAIIETFIPSFAWEQAKAGIPYAKVKIAAYEITIERLTGKWIDKPETR